MRYHSDEHAIIIMPSSNKVIYEDIDMDLSGFDEIYYIDYLSKIGTDKKTILNNFDKVWREHVPYSLEEFDEIVICAYWHPIMCKLIKDEISFTSLEEATGAYQRTFLHKVNFEEQLPSSVLEWGMEYGVLDYSSHSVFNKIYAYHPANDGIQDERVIHFDLCREISGLSKNELCKIKKLFSLEKCKEKLDKNHKESVLLLTTAYASKDFLSEKEELELYKYWLSYFAEGLRLIIKLHPGDIIDYEEVFKESDVLGEDIPGELLGLLDLKDALLIGYGSSLNDDFFYHKKLDFTYPEWKHEEYPLLHRFYALKMLYEEMFSQGDIRIFAVTKRGYMLRNFEVPYSDDLSGLDEDGKKLVYIDADDMEKDELERILFCKDVIVVFGELCNGYLSSVYKRKNQVIVKYLRIIHKDGTEDKIPIYLFTDDEEMSRIVRGWNYRKELQYLEDVVGVDKTWEAGEDSAVPMEVTDKYYEYLESENVMMNRILQNVKR